jgi:uncharacterized protein involved in exopolysaccharide biosynthesis
MEEINLMTYWSVLRRRKWFLTAACVLSLIAALIISMILPAYYESETVILPVSSESGGLGAAFSASPLVGAFVGATGIQTPADRVLVLLKSRTIAEDVIRRFDLLRLFNERKWDPAKRAWKDPDAPPLMQDAVSRLTRKVVEFNKSKEGAISITVEWKDPKLAADVANYYVSALTGLMNEKSINTTVQTIDRAVPAEKRSRPRVGLNLLLAGAAGLFSGLLLIFFLDYIEQLRAADPTKKTTGSSP